MVHKTNRMLNTSVTRKSLEMRKVRAGISQSLARVMILS